ncbi:phosphotransferase enzyme family-domain-containing protein [Bombardia bombarda]|uniref:non-specific serine/threonine protein kinase n=1 Tax=Bombardia bombarda TaxID=252184 RepID=A0AA39WCF8_9PEZI|nr:phosphotransferase enzyme family-domain-containing protein [Bombardia bombarda]
MPEDNPRDGLAWSEASFWDIPIWTREPQLSAVETVCRRVLAIDPKDSCTVTSFDSGTWNKLYLVESPAGRVLMRVSLPADPKQKVLGEATTLRWIRDATDVPVPDVIAFDDSQDNEITFEWILMELMPGIPASKAWRKMSMSDKKSFVEQVAQFQAQLFQQSSEVGQFRSIGTLYPDQHSPEPATATPKPGHFVDNSFFSKDHFSCQIPRGPYRSCHEWFDAYLEMIIQAQTEKMRIAQEEEDEDDLDEAEACRALAQKLKTAIPIFFPPPLHGGESAEQTVLVHNDLALHNILVDRDSAKVTAILDWECVSAKPLWLATKVPEFLRGEEDRDEEPQRSIYADASEDDEEEDNGLDNEGKNGLYWIHLMEYEQTQLRPVYTAKMKELWPQWGKAASSHRELDFYEALGWCESGWKIQRVANWADAVMNHTEGEEFPQLEDYLSAPRVQPKISI